MLIPSPTVNIHTPEPDPHEEGSEALDPRHGSAYANNKHTLMTSSALYAFYAPHIKMFISK